MIADGSRVYNNAEPTSINLYWTKSGVRLPCLSTCQMYTGNIKNLERHYSYAKWNSEFQVYVFWYFVMALIIIKCNFISIIIFKALGPRSVRPGRAPVVGFACSLAPRRIFC